MAMMSPRDQPDDHRDGWERRRDHAERVAGRKGCRQAAAASVALLVTAAIVIRRAAAR